MSNPMGPLPITPPITLSTGAVVVHARMPNGAQSATVEGRANGAMTEAEWQEYVRIIRGESRANG